MAKLELTWYTQCKIVRSVAEKAIKQFKELRDCVFEQDGLGGYFKRYRNIETRRFFGFIKTTSRDYDIVIAMSNTCVGFHLEARGGLEYDEATIWLAGQLEGLFNVRTVEINDVNKLGKPIGWRCAYCNTVNEATSANCQHCGAPRGW